VFTSLIKEKNLKNYFLNFVKIDLHSLWDFIPNWKEWKRSRRALRSTVFSSQVCVTVSAFISTQKNWVKNRWFQSKFINSWTAEPVSEWNSCMRRPRNMRPNIVSEVISFPIQDLQILNSVNCCFRDFLCYCDYLLLISIWCNWTGRVAY
jgi:hypothetical protein